MHWNLGHRLNGLTRFAILGALGAARSAAIPVPFEQLTRDETGAWLFRTDEAAKESGLTRPASGRGSVRLTAGSLRQRSFTYEILPQAALKLHVFFPADWAPGDRRPAMIWFHGYDFDLGGSADVFFPQAEYFASRGLVTVTAEYRQPLATGAEPDGTLEDARAAFNWLRAHAGELGVDASKIVAAGESWGATLAADLALVTERENPTGVGVNSVCALVLLTPALQPTPGATNKTDAVAAKLSPLAHVRKQAPPAIVFYGTADPHRKEGADLVTHLRALGNRCDCLVAEEQGPGFFNGEPWCTATAYEVDLFLRSLGHVSDAPPLKPNARLVRTN